MLLRKISLIFLPLSREGTKNQSFKSLVVISLRLSVFAAKLIAQIVYGLKNLGNLTLSCNLFLRKVCLKKKFS